MTTIVVVGLGPGGADLLLPAARAALARTPVRYVRTARHPAVAELAADGIDFVALDDHYDRGAALDDVYDSIVATLLTAARECRDIAYAVPGHPLTAERTVDRLLSVARDAGIAVEIVPGLSFADLAWSRVGLDPMTSGARIVDGRDFTFHAEPLLVAQCDNAFVLSDVKLALLDALSPDSNVTVLQRLGLPDEVVTTVALADLDRAVEPDHLTSVFVDARGTSDGDRAEVAHRDVGRALLQFVALVERLRGPGGCPWDAEQTHHSLTRHLLEEAYEVAEAIAALPETAPGPDADGAPVPAGAYDHLEEELGDLLFQVVFHATLAREAGAFTLADVATGIHDKLVRRHPHVFGTVEVDGAEDVVRNWEQIKRDEKGRESLMDGIPGNLPALLYVHKLYRKAAAGGQDDGDVAAAVARLRSVLEAGTYGSSEIGELLAAAVALARASGVDAEAALRAWAHEYRTAFMAAERTGAIAPNPTALSTEGAPPARD